MNGNTHINRDSINTPVFSMKSQPDSRKAPECYWHISLPGIDSHLQFAKAHLSELVPCQTTLADTNVHWMILITGSSAISLVFVYIAYTYLPFELWKFDYLDHKIRQRAIECCYNAVQHNMILHMVRLWLRPSMHQQLYWPKTPHFSSPRAGYVGSFVRIWVEIDHARAASHCIS